MDLSLVGEALKTAGAPDQLTRNLGGAGKLVFFKRCPGASDLQLGIKMSRGMCSDLSHESSGAFYLPLFSSKNKSSYRLHFFFTLSGAFMSRNL